VYRPFRCLRDDAGELSPDPSQLELDSVELRS
jgi:hypothetical protein